MSNSFANENNLYLVLTAAGSSSRMGNIGKKEYLKLGTGTVLSQSLKAFLKSAFFSHIVITIPAGSENLARSAVFADSEIKGLLKNSILTFVEGSSTRQESIFNALTYLKNNTQNQYAIVLVHDAARPFVTTQIIQDTISASQNFGAAVPAVSVVDTQKEVSQDGTITKHLERSTLKAVQTPQGFDFMPFFECHSQALKDKLFVTDDTQIWDAFPKITDGRKVHIVNGDIQNKKITYPEDVLTENKTIAKDKQSHTKRELKMLRVGFGTDLHKLQEGRRFLLGGVEIPSDKGELGHSDADVLLHAIADALLGASGMGDIGSYFPPEDNQWKDADSKVLLNIVWNDIQKKGWKLNNLDCVIEFEKPKFLPWRQKVIDSITKILGVNNDQIFVKAKTNEKVDAVGERLAIKAYCTCLLYKDSPENQ